MFCGIVIVIFVLMDIVLIDNEVFFFYVKWYGIFMFIGMIVVLLVY